MLGKNVNSNSTLQMKVDNTWKICNVSVPSNYIVMEAYRIEEEEELSVATLDLEMQTNMKRFIPKCFSAMRF